MELFIDVASYKDGMLIYHKLKRLKSTVSISKPVQYYFAGTVQTECIILLDSSMNEEMLDSWLYKTKGIDYIGSGKR